MLYNPKLFDPLKFLEHQLRLNVRTDRNGQIKLDGISKYGEEWRKQAIWVTRKYDKLLRMQLSDPRRPSVYKLIAQGKIMIKKGFYVKLS